MSRAWELTEDQMKEAQNKKAEVLAQLESGADRRESRIEKIREGEHLEKREVL